MTVRSRVASATKAKLVYVRPDGERGSQICMATNDGDLITYDLTPHAAIKIIRGLSLWCWDQMEEQNGVKGDASE